MSRRVAGVRPIAVLTPTEPASDGSVGEYLENWLWGKQSLRPSTHAAYESHVRRYLAPMLGGIALADLRPLHIERMHRHLATAEEDRPGLSVSTLHRLHATLMSAMNTAVKRGLIERNPAATVELPRRTRTRQETWDANELGGFLAQVADHRLHLLFVLLGLVGLRRGEAVALRWIDVDLNAGRLRIEQAAVRLGGTTIIGPPKSPSSIRVLALDEETARKFTWHAARQRLELRRATGDKRQPDLVFTTPDGGVLDPSSISREFDRLVARHGLRRIRLHDLRHTSASLGLGSGESLVEVSRRLGHSSITITADTYSHVSPLVAKDSVERLAATLYGHGR